MTNVLVVEDDDLIRSVLVKALGGAEYTALEAVDGDSARSILSTISDIDLMLLDIGLPDIDGLTLLREARDRGFAAPVIILTARDSVANTVEGLDSGANDYMVKPFRVPELLARIRLRLREHEASEDPGILEHAGMRLDIRTRRVEVDGRIQELTNREYSLLEMLLRNKGETISREQLLESVWGMDFDPGSNIVNVYIRSLRRKIGENKVHTVRGVGYRVE
ncbi:MAG: response regulator transcription factor [Dietzia sp.]|uniref:Response regulator transcription factor n=1 Tax=Dietzia cercidiphylli TaxID=498199 RepID=A0ABN2J4Q2_9ACTN|nr:MULTISPECIES: response regulator transcription factor [Dietzia]MBC7272836.1 response regulator transcription factor [Streptomyces sp.]MBB1035720.1 response regulator transcription factor [Dietzia sp. CQ4]MBB1037418.1 response regulator transcription factor [Dietzia natronolimnaea]MBB1040075.1 response regulator transcription factor [Dietzia sp. Cai40]MBB1043859.1 response regulator transcription factor [Dietzia sp. DQ11-44]